MNTGVVALILSGLALGVAFFALSDDEPAPGARAPRANADGRVIALEAKVERLTRELQLLKAADASTPPDAPAAPTGGSDAADPADTEMAAKGLEAIVDKAVDKKTKEVVDEMRIKANKKPDFKVFASMLELTEEQRIRAERVIVEGQRRVHEILNIPTADGVNLMDELVDIMAKGIAQPGKDHGWGRWIARAVNDKIPGMDMTYAAHIETVKSRMRGAFKRDWSKAQYKEFEEWGVDPTEVAKVPGSPNDALGARITGRAAAFGAEIDEGE